MTRLLIRLGLRLGFRPVDPPAPPSLAFRAGTADPETLAMYGAAFALASLVHGARIARQEVAPDVHER